MTFAIGGTADLKTEVYEFPLPKAQNPFRFINSAGLGYEAECVRQCLIKGELGSLELLLCNERAWGQEVYLWQNFAPLLQLFTDSLTVQLSLALNLSVCSDNSMQSTRFVDMR